MVVWFDWLAHAGCGCHTVSLIVGSNVTELGCLCNLIGTRNESVSPETCTGKIACKQLTRIYKCSRLQVWFEEWELDKRDLPTIHSLPWSFTTQNETKRMQGTKPRSSTPKVQPCINDPVYLLYMLMPEGILQYPNMSFQWYYRDYNFYSWFTMMRFLLVLSFAFW